eukprot:362180-Chlamydomonas_euryale.AAC.1
MVDELTEPLHEVLEVLADVGDACVTAAGVLSVHKAAALETRDKVRCGAGAGRGGTGLDGKDRGRMDSPMGRRRRSRRATRCGAGRVRGGCGAGAGRVRGGCVVTQRRGRRTAVAPNLFP